MKSYFFKVNDNLKLDSIKILNNSKNEDYNSINSKLNDILPCSKTLAKIIEYFFIESCNPLILHQLLLISNYFSYIDELGNRNMQTVIEMFLSDIDLDRKSLRPRNDFIQNIDFTAIKNIKMIDNEKDENDPCK
jgi:hypothetical protein